MEQPSPAIRRSSDSVDRIYCITFGQCNSNVLDHPKHWNRSTFYIMDQVNAPGSISRCVAKSEIEGLVHRYAVLATETPSIEKMSVLFTTDGVFRLPNGATVKPADLLQVVQGNNPDFIRHHITSIDIEFVSENEARTQAYFFAITHLSSFDHWGQWKDVVRRKADGNWKIADRTIIVEGGDSQGWYKKTYPS